VTITPDVTSDLVFAVDDLGDVVVAVVGGAPELGQRVGLFDLAAEVVVGDGGLRGDVVRCEVGARAVGAAGGDLGEVAEGVVGVLGERTDRAVGGVGVAWADDAYRAVEFVVGGVVGSAE
jgi:hypothetical protein